MPYVCVYECLLSNKKIFLKNILFATYHNFPKQSQPVGAILQLVSTDVTI